MSNLICYICPMKIKISIMVIIISTVIARIMIIIVIYIAPIDLWSVELKLYNRKEWMKK